MKKSFEVIMLLAVCFTLFSCGKSKEAISVDNLITEIGEVTLESESAILEAETAFEQLTEKQQNEIDNKQTLIDARSSYDELLENDLKRVEIQEAISVIGTVTLESEESIVFARKLYNSGNNEVKNSVENYSILENAEQDLSTLKVERVVGLIDSIGVVSLGSEENINVAQLAYNGLSYTEKEAVTNADVLYAAVQKVQEIKLNNAKSALTSRYDKIEGITWYYPKSKPYYANIRSYILPYIGQTSDNVWLRLMYHYTGDNWIFYDEVIIVIDGTRFTKSFGSQEINRDNGSGDVWEHADINPTSANIEMLWDISESKETLIRFKGDSKHYDMTVSAQDKKGIKDVLTAYELMKQE